MRNFYCKLFIASLLLLSAKYTQAQYANGTGTGLHQNQIFWLAWGGPSLISTPAGYTSTHIVEGTYVWNLEPGLVRVVGEVDNIQNPVAPSSGTLTLTPYSSGTYTGNGTTSLGDGLQLMYPGVNPIGMATKNSASVGSYNGGVIEFDINLKLQMLINGVWTDLNYPGMVMADAETMASNGSGTEYISAETNGTTGWQILDVRNDAASIGQNPTNYKLQIGNSGKYFRLYNNRVDNMGVQAVMYAQGTTTLTNVQMQGQGVTALALGFIAPFDYGDAPASYGEVPHYIDNLTLNGTPLTADGTYSVTSQQIASLVVPTANIYINQLPDPDGGLNHFSPNADIDGATTVPNYDGSGSYTLTIPITNNTGQPSNVGAWIDWDQNGVFDASEAVLHTNPASQTNASFTWNNLTTNPDPNTKYFVRVRVTTDPLSSPNAGATDGEVEDYALGVDVAISGNVFHDVDGLTNAQVDGTGTNVGGVLYVNLVNDSGIVVASVPVGSDGTYEFGGSLSGNYTLQLSTNQGVIGSPAPAVVLPDGWVSTGENLGHNAGNDGVVNTILPITMVPQTPLFDANFGIEQPPVADEKNHTIATPAIGTSLQLNGTGSIDSPGPLSGNDTEDGVMGSSKTVVITDLTSMNGNELYYNNVLITPGTEIDNYDPALLTIKFTAVGTTSLSFDYTFIDAASQTGTSGSYNVTWNTPLPVTLVSFTAAKEGKISVLSWVTTEETNSDFFQVQRSSDAKSWQDLGIVNAKGESNEQTRYFFNDNNPLKGSNLYRLKMVDRDGSFAYSRIRELSFTDGVMVSVYPNPVSDVLNVSEKTGDTLNETVLFNLNGRKVFQSSSVGDQKINVRGLTPGMYILKTTQTSGTVSSYKIIIGIK
ncbi:CshA/CshB family fibrillar adhesin-related protein [Dyadobacter sp. CY312]|uniref:CshA/CshB family fibrillar adhesin-related protein n=1 Tax=Dyadobacter sp. CY312 TaxID=2907303 RepID=UPI001F38561A|nr:CshA/CshB family fibrillar adhesin-related protein [Dyadobacter sp. CY312]MCE7043740.1 CshA/CshB family fibrillar adhesin-related protein [Dyadobacter sp. CY312]